MIHEISFNSTKDVYLIVVGKEENHTEKIGKVRKI